MRLPSKFFKRDKRDAFEQFVDELNEALDTYVHPRDEVIAVRVVELSNEVFRYVEVHVWDDEGTEYMKAVSEARQFRESNTALVYETVKHFIDKLEVGAA